MISGTYAGTSDTRCAGTSDTGTRAQVTGLPHGAGGDGGGVASLLQAVCSNFEHPVQLT